MGGGLFAVLLIATAAGACSGDSDDASANADATETTTAPTDEVVVVVDDCSPARSAVAGTQRLTFDHDGTTREYDLSVPDSYDGTAPSPLIVDLHGFSSNAAQEAVLTDMPEVAGERGYVVVTPQALEVDVPLTTGTINATFWNIDPAAVRPGFEPPDDIGFLDALVDQLEEDLCIDTGRQYVTGISNGAGMTMALICGSESRFAAAAPVAGVNLVGDCEPGEPTPLIAFHGDADPLIPYDGGQAVGQDYQVAVVQDRVASLAELAGCAPEPTVEEPFDDIVTRTWADCPEGLDFELVTVAEGGHTWPGTSIDIAAVDEATEGGEAVFGGFDYGSIAGHQTDNIEATELILDFFGAHETAPA